MSTGKRAAIAGITSAILLALVVALFAWFEMPTLGRAFVVVGFPLAYVVLKLTPDSFIRDLAPQSGPDAVGWAVTGSVLITWFVIFFVACFLLLGRMRSNPALVSDASASALKRASSSAPQRER